MPNWVNINIIDSVRAKAVVSKATPRPAVTAGNELSKASGDRLAMASVIPTTVPKKPRMGIAQMTTRTNA